MSKSGLAQPDTPVSLESASPPSEPGEAARLRDLTPAQWKSGLAAWLGWTFDGLDMHLYTLVALPFVAQLMALAPQDPRVGHTSSWIQAAFLVGWALGGGFFGRIGDRLGRTRALILTILTYALFTGLSFFATAWWHLFIFRFLAALGIGGEWAVGASLLSETWPRKWRPWLAGMLQSGVNVGILLASLAYYLIALNDLPSRTVFLVGVIPAFMVLWIRRAVPESAEWHAARAENSRVEPRILDLFRGGVRRTTILTILVCSFSLTAHWAFMFWCPQHLRNLLGREGYDAPRVNTLVSQLMMLLMLTSIAGNFLAAALARWGGYRRVIFGLCIAYGMCMAGAYAFPRHHSTLWWFFAAIGTCQGLFALFTMYLPPLFPTLLRTTGAGFCYNIGRIAAAAGTVFFGLFTRVGDYRVALLFASFLFVPAAAVAFFLPEHEPPPPAAR